MSSEHKNEPPDHVRVTNHGSESLVNRPSPGAPSSSGHDLPAGSAYGLRSREVTHYRLEFPDGGVVRMLDSPSNPDHAPLFMEFIVPPGAMPTAPHIHPRQEETYAVQEGSLEVLVGGSWFRLEAGRSATVPAGTPHSFRNRSDMVVRFLNEHRPALRFEEYFCAVHALATTGKLKGGFHPSSMLYACVLMKEYSDTMRAAGAAQGAVVRALAAVGRLLGVAARDPVESLSRAVKP